MNLLIVDDEPIIRVGLRTLVDWEANGFRLVGEAADGAEALQVMQQTPVDILITDILMPGMDGLELIRRTRAEWEDIGILVLSCLDDFAYVKEAMKLGASDYILKPTMEPEELIAILHEMKRGLIEQRSARNQISEWRAMIERSRSYQLSVRLRQAVEQGAEDAELEDEIWQGKAVYTIMVRGTGGFRLPVKEITYPDCRAVLRWNDQMMLLLYGCDKQPSMLHRYEQCYRQAETVRQVLLAETTALAATEDEEDCWIIGIGPDIQRLSELSGSVRYHERQYEHAFYSEQVNPILWDPGKEETFVDSMPYELRNDLLRCIVYSNGEALMHQVEQLTRWIKEQKPDVSRLNGFLFELLGLAVGYAREQGYSGLDEYEQKYVSLDTIQSLFPVGRLNEWLTQAFRELWSLRSGRGRSIPSNPFIRQALKFMEENYHRNIGTVDIAEHVRLSRSYLSDLFSREMGESLAETLTRIRMEEAKKRLAAGTMKIYEIAEAVGFSDAKTFTRTFRRFVGCSPKEYEAKMKH